MHDITAGSHGWMPLPSIAFFKYSSAHVALHQAAWEIHTKFMVFGYTPDSKLPEYSLRLILEHSIGPTQPSGTSRTCSRFYSFHIILFFTATLFAAYQGSQVSISHEASSFFCWSSSCWWLPSILALSSLSHQFQPDCSLFSQGVDQGWNVHVTLTPSSFSSLPKRGSAWSWLQAEAIAEAFSNNLVFTSRLLGPKCLLKRF